MTVKHYFIISYYVLVGLSELGVKANSKTHCRTHWLNDSIFQQISSQILTACHRVKFDKLSSTAILATFPPNTQSFSLCKILLLNLISRMIRVYLVIIANIIHSIIKVVWYTWSPYSRVPYPLKKENLEKSAYALPLKVFFQVTYILALSFSGRVFHILLGSRYSGNEEVYVWFCVY